ncbi:MAG: hypothetical protein ACRCV5_02645 [Afipia sp.]
MNLIFCIGLLFLAGCKFTDEKPAVIESAPKADVKDVAPPPAMKEKKPVPIADKREEIFKIADGSKCALYKWKNRGQAPAAYFRGVALAYYRAHCDGTVPKAKPASTRDALALYNLPATLRATYTLLIGLGLRESTGRYCVGLDITNASSRTADTCESGPFQVSYNSRHILTDKSTCCQYNQPDLVAIYKKWQGKSEKECELDVWSKGVTCSAANWNYVGDPKSEGVKFQKLMKTCPAFAVEYTVMGLRLLRHHWGPIKNQEAEYNTDCEAMLAAVEKVGCV